MPVFMVLPLNPVSAKLLAKYNQSVPRYTSYPPAVYFNPNFHTKSYEEAIRSSNEKPLPSPLSLYVHIPFCNTLCYYCGCTKFHTKKHSKISDYLEWLHKEIEQVGALFKPDRLVNQLHFGGGTPTLLTNKELGALIQKFTHFFKLNEDEKIDFSIEIDPRTITEQTFPSLRTLGFNRASIGVQDFDPNVQEKINRLQSEEQTWASINAARKAKFFSINIDLIYGLPLQTLESFSKTLTTVIAMKPERIAAYSYAHLPEAFTPQKKIPLNTLPSAEEKRELFFLIVDQLTQAGYLHIGLDHFALPTDTLAKSFQEATLRRNFQGYTTHADCEIVGFGISSISQVGNCYAQNHKDLGAYVNSLQQNELPIERGFLLSFEDELRRDLISRLMCYLNVPFSAIERQYHILFHDHFAKELSVLKEMSEEGLVKINDEEVRVTSPGRLFLRNIAAVFDPYFVQKQDVHYSKSV